MLITTMQCVLFSGVHVGTYILVYRKCNGLLLGSTYVHTDSACVFLHSDYTLRLVDLEWKVFCDGRVVECVLDPILRTDRDDTEEF